MNSQKHTYYKRTVGRGCTRHSGHCSRCSPPLPSFLGWFRFTKSQLCCALNPSHRLCCVTWLPLAEGVSVGAGGRLQVSPLANIPLLLSLIGRRCLLQWFRWTQQFHDVLHILKSLVILTVSPRWNTKLCGNCCKITGIFPTQMFHLLVLINDLFVDWLICWLICWWFYRWLICCWFYRWLICWWFYRWLPGPHTH